MIYPFVTKDKPLEKIKNKLPLGLPKGNDVYYNGHNEFKFNRDKGETIC